jgi:aryl-alcohol dehydrogenase-like predicted oxidoreductase
LIKAKEYLRYFDEIIAKYNLTRQEASLLFSLQQSKNDFIVFGVDTIEQLVENCRIATSNIKIDNCITELKKVFGMTDRNTVIPSLWKK